MKSQVILYKFSIFMGILVMFVQCATSQNQNTETKKQVMNQPEIEETAPVAIEQPYFQEWVAGVEEGGRGFNVVLPLKEASEVELKEIYFQGKKIELLPSSDNKRYLGNYKHPEYKKSDLIMSDDPRKEYGNQMPVMEKPIPFSLNNDEAVISYMEGDLKKYFKISGITKKQMVAYPEAPPQN